MKLHKSFVGKTQLAGNGSPKVLSNQDYLHNFQVDRPSLCFRKKKIVRKVFVNNYFLVTFYCK